MLGLCWAWCFAWLFFLETANGLMFVWGFCLLWVGCLAHCWALGYFVPVLPAWLALLWGWLCGVGVVVVNRIVDASIFLQFCVCVTGLFWLVVCVFLLSFL